MSPTSADRWKETLQSVCAIVVLAALFWFGRHGLGGRGGSDGDATGLFDFAGMFDDRSDFDHCDSDDDCGCDHDEHDHHETLNMPVCVDLEESVERLVDARNNMTRLAVDSDGQGILIAGNQYREAVKEVQAGFAKLKMRVHPDDFASISENFLCSYETDEQSVLMVWELGHFAEEIGE